MKTKKKFIIVIVILLLIGVFFGGYKLGSEKREPKISESLLQNRLESASQLISLDYIYTNMSEYSDVNYFYGWEVPFTEKKFIISYNGSIKSGVDLKQMNISISGDTIDIKLPPAKILAHEIDENSIKIFNEKNSIFNPLKVDDMKDFTIDQKEKVEKDAIKKGLLDQAFTKAQESIMEILSIDKINEKYKINIIKLN